jgi:hypothetical protein
VEDVRDRPPEFHQLLTAAVTDADAAQDTATQAQNALAQEEARRQSLVSETNARLGACPHTQDQVVGARSATKSGQVLARRDRGDEVLEDVRHGRRRLHVGEVSDTLEHLETTAR